MGRFTINLMDSSRAITYPPTLGDIPNLRFEVKFYSGTTFIKKFIGEGQTTLTGTIAAGDYDVDVDVFYKLDTPNTILSVGGAVSNPVTINPGNNVIPVALHKAVTITPSTPTVAKGGSQLFSAVVYGQPPGTSVTWAVSPTSGGSTINSSGLLSVAAGETATALEVTASYGTSPVWRGAVGVTVSAGVMVSTIAGIGDGVFSWLDNLNPLLARFNVPEGVAFDTSWNLYIADTYNYRIRKMDGLTGEVTTVAGGGTSGDVVNTNPLLARFNTAGDLAVDSTGNIFVADQYNHKIKKIDGATGAVTVLAGSTQGFADGPGATAQFNYPSRITVDSTGNILVSDSYNYRVRKIDSLTGAVTTFAGDGTPGYLDNTNPLLAQFDAPGSLAVDNAGNVFVTDSNNHRIRRIDGTTGEVTTFAGDGTSGSLDGPRLTAQFNTPHSVAVDSAGNVFVTESNTVRKIDGATGMVSTIAGTPGSSGYTDGPGATARFAGAGVGCIAIDSTGNLYVSDSGNNVIRKVTF